MGIIISVSLRHLFFQFSPATFMSLNIIVLLNVFCVVQLKYHDTGREKDCLPQVGQWNMMNKVISKVRTICVLEYLGMNM